MGLSLQGDDALYVCHSEVIAGALVFRGELLHDGTLREGHVVLVGGEYPVGILLRGLLDKGEKGAFLLFPVYDKGSAEYLVAAMLGVDLGEAEYLAVSQRAAVLFLQLVQVVHLLGREGQSLLLVIFLQIVYVLDGLRLVVNGEHSLVYSLVHALQHGVMLRLGRVHGEEFLYAADALEAHVLRDFHGIGAPGGDHLPAGTHEIAFQGLRFLQFRVAIEPAQFVYLGLAGLVVNLRGDDTAV